MRRSRQIIGIDRLIHRVFHDKWGLLAIAGVPSLTLISIGRNSGLPRRTQLLCQPRGDFRNPATEGKRPEERCPEEKITEEKITEEKITEEKITESVEYVIVGSNWGRRKHPAWVYNLDARPRVRILVRGKELSVTARRVTGHEYQSVWTALTEFWPGYLMERQMAQREFPIFILSS
jgi:deazaflavin-dependent oxidoreductase (nitroreductase family)